MKLSLASLLAGMAVLPAAWTDRIARSQQGDAPNGNASALRFEVTSVKETETMPATGEFAGIRAMAGGTYMARYATLKSMIREVYKIADVQIAGGPRWIDTARFDVKAKAKHPDNIGNLDIMFQDMLAHRFKLQFHRETRTLPVWVVTADKNGSKMKVNPSPEQFEVPIKLSRLFSQGAFGLALAPEPQPGNGSILRNRKNSGQLRPVARYLGGPPTRQRG